jgi:two-component system chemotaxis response regulator CheB
MDAIVVNAGSAGGFEALRRFVAALPTRCTASFFIVIHIGSYPSVLRSLLARTAGLHSAFAYDGAPIEAGRIYVAPPDHHMLLEPSRVRLNQGPKVHHTRPAADPLFISAAKVFGERVIGIVLSGGGSDGADGLRAIKEHGGTALVQRPQDALAPSMPLSAIAAVHPDAVLSISEIQRSYNVWLLYVPDFLQIVLFICGSLSPGVEVNAPLSAFRFRDRYRHAHGHA